MLPSHRNFSKRTTNNGGRSALVPGLKVELFGNLQVLGADGAEVKFSERRAQALVAILATSNGYRRSRDWLKATLWPRSHEPQSANSLRQTLYSLRKSLGDSADCLCSSRSHVWLQGVGLEAGNVGTDAIFYEDAPVLDEPFEDWLRQRRATQVRFDARASWPQYSSIGIGLAPPIASAKSPRSEAVANLLCNQIVDTLRMHELMQVFDLRDLGSNQLGMVAPQAPRQVTFLMRLSFVELCDEQQITFQVNDATTQRVIWSVSIRGETEGPFQIGHEQLTDFTAQIVDAIHSAAERLTGPSETSGMLAAVHQVLSHSVEGQQLARKMLMQDIPHTGLSNAWCAYTFAIVHGERHAELDNQQFEELSAFCRKSIESDPSNPLARALIAHVMAFVFKDYESAQEHVEIAKRIGPGLAMTWRSSALLAHYTGDLEHARLCAARAHRLGQYSPYRGVFSTSSLFAAATSGRRAEAIRLGERILTQRPSYLAAMRHLFPCYALEGETAKARKMLTQIRDADPRLTPKGIRDPNYPLPAGHSVHLIEQGFNALGIAN